MTKVTVTGWTAPCKVVWGTCSLTRRLNNLHLMFSKMSPKDLSFPSCRREPGFMASAELSTRQLRRFRPFLLLNVFLIVSIVIFPAALGAQTSTSTSTSSSSSSSSSSSNTTSRSGAAQLPTSQVQTSAQNPVFGSVPEAKPTPGVLQLTFSNAIERALRQNLAGLLSEYNTIDARGEKWQKLSYLLPNVRANVPQASQKQRPQPPGLAPPLFP